MYVIKGIINDIPYFFVCSTYNQEFGNTVRQLSTVVNDAYVFDTLEQAIDMINDCHLKNFVPFRMCPKCYREYREPPAISRVDDKTEICGNCGMLEALDDFLKDEES